MSLTDRLIWLDLTQNSTLLASKVEILIKVENNVMKKNVMNAHLVICTFTHFKTPSNIYWWSQLSCYLMLFTKQNGMHWISIESINIFSANIFFNVGVLRHAQKLFSFTMRDEKAYLKFKAHIESGPQTTWCGCTTSMRISCGSYHGWKLDSLKLSDGSAIL